MVVAMDSTSHTVHLSSPSGQLRFDMSAKLPRPSGRMAIFRRVDISGIFRHAHPREPWCACLGVSWFIGTVILLMVLSMMSPSFAISTVLFDSLAGGIVSIDVDGLTAALGPDHVWGAIEVSGNCTVVGAEGVRRGGGGIEGRWEDVGSFKHAKSLTRVLAGDWLLVSVMRGGWVELECVQSVEARPALAVGVSVPLVYVTRRLRGGGGSGILGLGGSRGVHGGGGVDVGGSDSGWVPFSGHVLQLESHVSSVDTRGATGSVTSALRRVSGSGNATTARLVTSRMVPLTLPLASQSVWSAALTALSSGVAALASIRVAVGPLSTCARSFWKTERALRVRRAEQSFVLVVVGSASLVVLLVASLLTPVPFFVAVRRVLHVAFERPGVDAPYLSQVATFVTGLFATSMLIYCLVVATCAVTLTFPCWPLQCRRASRRCKPFFRPMGSCVGLAVPVFFTATLAATAPLLAIQSSQAQVDTSLPAPDWASQELGHAYANFLLFLAVDALGLVLLTVLGRGILHLTIFSAAKKTLYDGFSPDDPDTPDGAATPVPVSFSPNGEAPIPAGTPAARFGIKLAHFLACVRQPRFDLEEHAAKKEGKRRGEEAARMHRAVDADEETTNPLNDHQ